MDRRDFLATSALATVGLGLAPGTPPGQQTAGGLQLNQFASLVGSTFTAIDERGTVRRLTLAAVRPGPVAPPLDQFSLVFDRADTAGACEGLCWMRHAEIGWFQLRLEAAVGACCAATFSLLT